MVRETAVTDSVGQSKALSGGMFDGQAGGLVFCGS